MSTVHRHNPLLRSKLMTLLRQADAEAMANFLSALSVSDFRTAGFLLSEEVLPTSEEQTFWTFFVAIVPLHPKAYLGTFLKACVSMYRRHRLSLSTEALQAFAASCTPIDRKKILETLLPVMHTSDEVGLLIQLFCREETNVPLIYLIKAHTVQAYYQLFLRLKKEETSTVRSCILSLMKMNDALSFNMASLMKRYFDIPNVPGSFSLQVNDYELSRMDQGYDAFVKMLKR